MADNSGAVVSSSQNSGSRDTNGVAENQGNGQANAEGQQQQQQQGGIWSMVKSLVMRGLMIYFITSLFRGKQTPATTDNKTAAPANQLQARNIFARDIKIDMYVYLSDNEVFTDFKNKELLMWKKVGLVYGDWTSGKNKDGIFERSTSFPTPESVLNNGSLYLHTYFVPEGRSPDPADKKAGSYTKRETVYRKKQLNKYKRKKYHKTVNLLTGTTDAHPDSIQKENDTDVTILNHWHPNITINFLDDQTPWVRGSIPQPLDEYIEFDITGSWYFPVIYYNDYWNLNSEYMPINETTPRLNLTITYQPISLFRWQMYAAQGMKSKWYAILGDDAGVESDEDQDTLKRTFLETNPYLLALTVVVSIIHSVFEFLAFKNDIQFWRNRKSLEGLSVRSVFFNIFQSMIVVLYVLDNETNTVVRISVGIGLLIECWKITKVVDIKFGFENKLFGILPISIKDKSTYTESETKKYDKLAFKYLSWILFPLLIAYSIYSVIYQEHRGWYSWVLSLMYGFLLTFGFIMMTPQLFINYKLKSVAHLPWRMLTYKALNTFIDDIFAFVIKMPTLYRIGCLRDDVIFFIYLYQKWIYPVDKRRVNEFGLSGDMLDSDGNIIQPEAEITENGEPGGDAKKTESEKKND